MRSNRDMIEEYAVDPHEASAGGVSSSLVARYNSSTRTSQHRSTRGKAETLRLELNIGTIVRGQHIDDLDEVTIGRPGQHVVRFRSIER